MSLLDLHGQPLSSGIPAGAVPSAVGTNLDSGVQDVGIPFPEDWLRDLRELSPVTTAHSYLVPYWYRAKERWVLYDAVPVNLIDPDQPQAPGLMGFELLNLLTGNAPRHRPQYERTPFVSDVQHEMFRRWKVYARPFWILQGDRGGHQVRFSPDQVRFLTETGRSTTPPAVGALDPCPFDGRVTGQLRRVNRLYQLNGSLTELRKSASGEAADRQLEREEREIRAVALDLLEQQLGELAATVKSAANKSVTADQVIQAPGMASQAKDALDVYRETGQYTM